MTQSGISPLQLSMGQTHNQGTGNREVPVRAGFIFHTLPFTSCVPWRESLHLFGPQFAHL